MSNPQEYRPHVTPIETGFPSNRSVQIEEINFSGAGLKVLIASDNWHAKAHFDAIYGFRVLDEYDLTDFWAQCNLKDGWLFEVTEGGWNSLELTRAAYVSGRLYQIREFLITGFNECVSVLTQEPPIITADTITKTAKMGSQ